MQWPPLAFEGGDQSLVTSAATSLGTARCGQPALPDGTAVAARPLLPPFGVEK